MKELFDIARRYEEVRGRGEPAALATVLRTAGSTYRLPGARMLIDAGGGVTGCVSGGCLERDVIEHAQRLLVSGEPRIVVYDTRDDEHGDWSFGLGCKGRVDVLVERLADDAASPVRFIDRCLRSRDDGVIATVAGVTVGSSPATVRIGQRLLATPAGVAATSIADSTLNDAVWRDAAAVLASESTWKSYDLGAGGRVDVLIERIRRALRLIVCGCGHDAVPLVRLARELGWLVTVVDHRPRNLSRARSISAVEVVAAQPDAFARAIALDDRCAVVVMNHHFVDDRTILAQLLASPVGYVGLLGPRARTAQLISEVQPPASSGEARPRSIHGPVGLDIGAENPEEIAVSIVAEILAVFADREGGHASNRVTPLHAATCTGKTSAFSGSVAGNAACAVHSGHA